jgi:DNA-binding NtrC family response regulator
MNIKLLIAEDELNLSFVLQKELARQGCAVTLAHNGDEAVRYARQEEFHVALLDLMIPGANGIQVLRALCEQEPAPEVIIMTGHATVNTALEAMKLGAYDYLTKPCSLAELTEVIRKAHEKNQLKRENLVLQSLVKHHSAPAVCVGTHGIITQHEQMEAVLAQIELVASSLAPALISGASGTGKELIARAIHSASTRRHKPFVTFNCATTPEALVEAELFGHEAGAFTTARTRKLGLFELAQHGTLLLEEVSCLSSVVQVRLQRALDTMSFYRIGGTRKIEADVRIIATTSQNLQAQTQQGQFRHDLYHRLNGIRIALPPLCERRADILPLAEHFLHLFAPQRQIYLAPEARRVLTAYHWPGNVRELRNVIERAVLLARSNLIQPSDLLVELTAREAAAARAETGGHYESVAVGMDHGFGTVNGAAAAASQAATVARLEETERREILSALERTNWHQGKTAELLGISPSTLYRRLREYKITKRMMRMQRAAGR